MRERRKVIYEERRLSAGTAGGSSGSSEQTFPSSLIARKRQRPAHNAGTRRRPASSRREPLTGSGWSTTARPCTYRPEPCGIRTGHLNGVRWQFSGDGASLMPGLGLGCWPARFAQAHYLLDQLRQRSAQLLTSGFSSTDETGEGGRMVEVFSA